MKIPTAVLVLLFAAILAGCGGGDSGSGGSDSETVITARLNEATGALVLTDFADHTLYTFSGTSCEGSCTDTWPPMVAEGKVVAESNSGLDPSLLGSTERPDGQSQVTYDGKPLYLYSKDEAGQSNGTDSTSFGGTWRPATTNPFERKTTTGISCEPNCDY
jgi:predicted lipoprotein with Yx(FWY)xxD motif